MKVLNPEKNPSRFFERLATARQSALLLDYDGTLAPFRTERHMAVPYPGVTGVLGDLAGSRETRVVVISGRTLDDLVPLLELQRLPEIWGSHGGERLLRDGTRKQAPLDSTTRDALERAGVHLANMGWKDRLERKPFSIALHWRGTDPAEQKEMTSEFMQYATGLGADVGLSLKKFDGGLELRSQQVNKGQAVKTILSELPGDAAVAYLGDDLTDEDAFAVLHEQNMQSIGVLVRENYRKTKADLWLRPPTELLDFLKSWKAATFSTRETSIHTGKL
jgi:trehalose-phosphatase